VLGWAVRKSIAVHFSVEQLKALVHLSENQLFRMKFIDPKMPGYKIDAEVLRAAQSAVGILHDAMTEEKDREVKLEKVKTQ
jgi:hypothetical protein